MVMPLRKAELKFLNCRVDFIGISFTCGVIFNLGMHHLSFLWQSTKMRNKELVKFRQNYIITRSSIIS